MPELNHTFTVQQQYGTSNNLNIRIAIHARYSTNKQGFGNWIFGHYNIRDGMRVLELGCGTGEMWKDHTELIGRCSSLVLSDFSAGMVEQARQNVGPQSNIEYQQIDIQHIL